MEDFKRQGSRREEWEDYSEKSGQGNHHSHGFKWQENTYKTVSIEGGSAFVEGTGIWEQDDGEGQQTGIRTDGYSRNCKQHEGKLEEFRQKDCHGR